MAVYTVHQPPLRKGETSPDPDRFALVRDGFHFWAFVFGPVWMLWRRLWLVAVLYLVLVIGLEVALRYAGASGGARALVTLAVALLVGLEAATLQRWTLGRRGYRNVGVVVGDDTESAERRFFSDWVDNQPAPQSVSAPAKVQTPLRNPTNNGNDVLGLFPESGQTR